MGGDNVSEVRTKRFPNKVSVTHDGLNYEIDVDAEISIDPQNLQEAFTRHPGQYAFYAAVHAAALHVADRAKLNRDVVRSQVADELRKSTNPKTGKPYSEQAIDSIRDSDERVVKAIELLLEARRQEEILRAVREAFAHRRDCLIQLGANERLEKQSY